MRIGTRTLLPWAPSERYRACSWYPTIQRRRLAPWRRNKSLAERSERLEVHLHQYIYIVFSLDSLGSLLCFGPIMIWGQSQKRTVEMKSTSTLQLPQFLPNKRKHNWGHDIHTERFWYCCNTSHGIELRVHVPRSMCSNYYSVVVECVVFVESNTTSRRVCLQSGEMAQLQCRKCAVGKFLRHPETWAAHVLA